MALAEQVADLGAQPQSAHSIDEVAYLVMEALMKWIPRTVVVLKDRMDMNKPIHAYGIDSLTAAGLRSWFAKAFGVSTAVFEILAGASFRELGSAAAKKYKEKEKEKYKENGRRWRKKRRRRRRRKSLRLVRAVKIGFVALKNARLIEVRRELRHHFDGL